jgi:hypothetical protein
MKNNKNKVQLYGTLMDIQTDVFSKMEINSKDSMLEQSVPVET